MRTSSQWQNLVGQWFSRISWRSASVTFFFFVMFFYFMFGIINDHYSYHTVWYERPAPCITPKYIMDEMVSLTFKVSNLLFNLNISHVLCYGTLWGALRYGQTLPWDNNADFCVMKYDLEKVPTSTLYAHFKANDMNISYDHRHGEYIIEKGPAKGILTVFYATPFNEVLRDGFEHRLLWYFQDSPPGFPFRLVEPPLKKIAFHGHLLPVPNEDLEILKYLYKDDWWIEKAPPGCLVKN